MYDEMYALVKLYNGVVEEVVIGCDPASLEAQGDAWVAEYPGNNEYTIVAPKVSPCHLSHDAPLAILAILADIAAWAREAADNFGDRDPERDWADFDTIARHARRGLALLTASQEVEMDVEALAREAVEAMGDVFYDPCLLYTSPSPRD